MKKWIALVLLAGLAGGGLWLRARYREAAEVAAPDAVVELTADGIAAGLRSEDPKRRMDALAQIDRLDPDARRAAVLGSLGSPIAAARLGVLADLGPLATDRAVIDAVIRVAREDEDADVRQAALRALLVAGDVSVLDVAVELLSSTEAPLAVRVRAAETLDRLTGRETAADLAGRLSVAEEEADLLSMDWDDWLSGNRDGLRWDAGSGRFVSDD